MANDDAPMKTLAPEILPPPREGRGGDPRARTRARLTKLLKAAGGSVAALNLCYCVVDMMVEPASCADTSSGDWVGGLFARALLGPPTTDTGGDTSGDTADTGASVRRRVGIVLRDSGNAEQLTLSDAVVVTGGELLSAVLDENGSLEVQLTVLDGTTEVEVVGSVECAGATTPWRIRIDPTALPSTGSTVVEVEAG